MLNIDVIKPGLFTSVQDGGRKGFAFYGIPASGYMDVTAAHIANMLVGNKKNSPLLEMNFVGGVFKFNSDSVIAITGADMQASLNGDLCKTYQTLIIKKGEVLHFKNTIDGARSYLAIQGAWKIPEIYGSKSTFSIGNNAGLACAVIKATDRIKIQTNLDAHKTPLVLWPQIPKYNMIKTIHITKGPEHVLLKNPRLLSSSFSISRQSDRMGAILDGPVMETQLQESFTSKYLFPGMIQCTPSGKLIVVLQDGQTTGGYPRVGIISKKELDRFNQLQPGMDFNFSVED